MEVSIVLIMYDDQRGTISNSIGRINMQRQADTVRRCRCRGGGSGGGWGGCSICIRDDVCIPWCDMNTHPDLYGYKILLKAIIVLLNLTCIIMDVLIIIIAFINGTAF